MIRVWFTFILLLQLMLSDFSFAQRPYSLLMVEEDYKNASELFEKEKFVAAQKEFQQIVYRLSGVNSVLKTRAEYYHALCGVYLFNNDAEYYLDRFVGMHPESMLSRNAVWEMALFLYQTKKYRKAGEYFNRVDQNMLAKEEQAEYYFKKGYCSFVKNDYENATLAFYEIKDIQSEYSGPALYYYSYIAYKQENFETALLGFRRLEDDVNFSGIVPYYILQILYSQKKYEEIVQIGPGLLENSIPGRSGEIAKFVGDSYYQLKNYSEAQTYLELYVEKTKNITREDKFQMGFMYHQLKKYSIAIPFLEGLGGKKDLLGQNSYYLLADCFLKTENKPKAAIAFFTAAGMDFDSDISEDALLNYAKLTYELAFSPFNEAIRAFHKFIEMYPYSQQIDEAYHYLVLAYLNTRNYKYAYESLNKIQEKNPEIMKAYQRVAFYRGLELYQDLKFEKSLDMFDVSLAQGNFDPALTARCLYWKAEALYRNKDLSEALIVYQEFLISPGAYSQKEFNVAHYNTAYCYFNLKDYANASRWYRKYVALIKGSKSKLLADSYNRLGDCAFISTDYSLAMSFYQKSIDLKSSYPDYALFQKSFAHGLQKNYFDKIDGLTKLLNDFPKSNYRDDALYERGRSYVQVNKSDRALDDFFEILESYKNSSYYSKALLNIGLVYYNQGSNAEAIQTYKRVISEFEGTPDSRSALTGLKTVYVDMNEVETYFSYVGTLGSFANVRVSEQDSLTYLSGENLYMSGNCERAIQVLSDYLDKFQNGSFVINASFYRAECLSYAGRKEEALKDYKYVVDKPKNVFTEPSLLVVSSLNFRDGAYFDALENYVYLENVADVPENRLTALVGQFRCLFELKDFTGVVNKGQKILKADKLTEEIAREVYFKSGLADEELGSPDKAIDVFRKVAVDIRSEEGAEAKYRIAKTLYDQEKIDASEAEVMEFIEMNTPHQEWMARIFILSSDISLKKNDIFQARYTLQSLIDYYDIEDDGIKNEARERLNYILELEKEEQDSQDEAIDSLNMDITSRLERNRNIIGLQEDVIADQVERRTL